MEIRPELPLGVVPASNCPTLVPSGDPGAVKKPSTKPCVGVVTVRLPTFTTPLAPTTNPWGLANQTLPPIRPSLMAFRMPYTSVRWSRTMLIRLVAAEGTCRFTVLPAPTLKVLKELKALLPETVPVFTFQTAPLLPTSVSVRPSGVITVWAMTNGMLPGSPSERSARPTIPASLERRRRISWMPPRWRPLPPPCFGVRTSAIGTSMPRRLLNTSLNMPAFMTTLQQRIRADRQVPCPTAVT
jgi:hypothetical protein